MVINFTNPIHPYSQIFFQAINNAGGGGLYSYEIEAIDKLVKDLFFFNIWNKIKILYPFVGRNSISHAVNLIDPRTYTITWTGTVTHDANGITGNGTTGTGNTGFNPNTAGGFADNMSFGVYVRSSTATNTTEIGLGGAASRVRTRNVSGNTEFEDPANVTVNANANPGLIYSNRLTGIHQGWINGLMAAANATAQGGVTNAPVFVLAGSAAAGFSAKNISMAFMGVGLSDTDGSNFHFAVKKFQTILKRQVI